MKNKIENKSVVQKVDNDMEKLNHQEEAKQLEKEKPMKKAFLIRSIIFVGKLAFTVIKVVIWLFFLFLDGKSKAPTFNSYDAWWKWK